jgi:NaMN:DMB phosphoribosyltransferase
MEHAMADAGAESKPVNQDALVADIDRTRTELARTIDAISDRVSPKKNAQRVADQLRERGGRIDPVMVGAAAAAVVIGVSVLLLLRRRKR